MARIKRSRTGLSYFGKKVETQEIRFDKNVFVQKLSGFIIDGKQVSKTTLATRNLDGLTLTEMSPGRRQTLTDNDFIPNARELFSVNFFIISPTSNRTFKMPTENDIETILTAADGPQFETHQAYRFTIINTGSATVLDIIGGIGTTGVHDTKITSSVAAASAAIAINGIAGVTASVTDHVVTVTCDEAGNTVLATSTFASSNTASIALTTDGTDAAGYGGLNASREIIIVSQSTAWTYSSSYAEGYDHAVTPWVTSQFQSGVVKNLFKFHTLADGTSTNTEYKISIAGLKEIDDIDGEEQYSTFNVLVRKYGDKDSRPIVLEQFNNVNLDPHSSQFISRFNFWKSTYIW